MTRSWLCCLALLLVAACNPSRPIPGDPDGGVVVIDAPDPVIDAPPPPPPPGNAMEAAVGGGHVESSSLVMDVQIGGGLPGVAAGSTETVRPAPALP